MKRLTERYLGVAVAIGSFLIQDCFPFVSAISEEALPYWRRESTLHEDILSGAVNGMDDYSEYNSRVPPKVLDNEDPVVKVGINVFKIKEINIANSYMSLNAWLRISWNDPRLAWNSSDPKYFNVNQTTFKASTDPEITQVWVPDLELYNQDESLSNLADKDVIVYPDGSVFWSRIGNLGALCAFSGIIKHPFDVIECTMDFSGWARSGKFADYKLMDPPVMYQETGTGKSTYQEYAILKGKERASRNNFFYPCCPDEAWPTLSFTFVFERTTTGYYQRSLVIIMIGFTFLSAAVFFFDIRCGERLGYGITVLLAMIATEIIASEMLPTCPEFIWIEVMCTGSNLFAIASLVESCVVTHIYYKQRPEEIPEYVEKKIDDKSNDDDYEEEEDFQECILLEDSSRKGEVVESSKHSSGVPKLSDYPNDSISPNDDSTNRSTLRRRSGTSALAQKFKDLTRRAKKKENVAEERHKRWREERGLDMEAFKLVQRIDRISFIVFIATYPLFLILMYSSIPLWRDDYAVNL